MSSARQRELFRYFPLLDDKYSTQDEQKASYDPCLTAFAQLGVLRMNAKRGYITLSTCDANRSHYVLAESSPALSLQKDNDKNDELWHGVGKIKEVNCISTILMTTFCQPQGAPTFIFTGDIREDLRFKHFYTENDYRFRSMAVVPLKSVMHGMIIGLYVVLDENPREDLGEDDIQFLYDMATTVSDHLEAERLRRVQHRSERMVKALGLFIEGKGTLRHWWLKQGHRTQLANLRKTTDRPLELLADMEFGIQERVDYFSKHGLHELQNDNYRASFVATSPASSAPSRCETTITESHDFQGDARSPLPPGEDLYSASLEGCGLTPQSFMITDASIATSDAPDFEKQAFVSFELPPETSPQGHSQTLHKSYLTGDIKRVFARASNLLRESIGVEGVVYFETVTSYFSIKPKKKEPNEIIPPSAFQQNVPIGPPLEDYNDRISSDTDTAQKFCRILGYSTKTRSSLYGHRVSEELQHFPVSVMNSLLKNYPNGSIFNLDDDGFLLPESDENLISPPQDGSERKKEADAILSVLPGARSVFWFPLWDLNHGRWYSGSLVWSNSPKRTFCLNEDLTYLAAFGNSTMAEVSRLSAQELSKMKTDFISSISHELRSPLHGVLASVELLQETQMNEVQIEMANNIHASGKILLDTINHVLDFSKVNPRAKNGRKTSRNVWKRSRGRAGSDDDTHKADMCIVSEEVIDTIYTGHIVSKKPINSANREASQDHNPVSIIVSIPFRENWTYEIDKGAWRRILMNLFSNAMKYTLTGFVRVSLDVEDPLPLSSSKKSSRSTLILKVKDSGKGISEHFLKHQLFKPFTQEDTLAVGAGLGLSIVKAVVQGINGKISFISEPGTGTEVTVRIPLKKSTVPKKVEERKIVMDVRERCEGLEVKMVGFDRYPDLGEEPTGILSAEIETAIKLRKSTEACLRDWFGIQILTIAQKESIPDIVVIMEAGLNNNSIEDIMDSLGHGQIKENRIAIVLTSRYHTTLKVVEYSKFKTFYLQLPFGPHKVARILHQAFCQLEIYTTALSSASAPTPDGPSESSCQPAVTPDDAFHLVPLQPTRKTPLRPPKPLALSSNSTVSSLKPPSSPLLPLQGSSVQTPISTTKKILRVLLVEDNEINLRLLVATMRKLKLDYVTAVNGLEALNAYKECHGRFDVIFMVMSGIESSKCIRAFEKENDLDPVALIALTGAANELAQQEAFSNGIDIFLTKPVPMKALQSMLDDFAVI